MGAPNGVAGWGGLWTDGVGGSSGGLGAHLFTAFPREQLQLFVSGHLGKARRDNWVKCTSLSISET